MSLRLHGQHVYLHGRAEGAVAEARDRRGARAVAASCAQRAGRCGAGASAEGHLTHHSTAVAVPHANLDLYHKVLPSTKSFSDFLKILIQ